MYGHKERIDMTDSLMTAIIKVSDGNPGAITVCAEVMKRTEEIDPMNCLGGMGIIFDFDSHGIYGEKIWILYKDICGHDMVTMQGLLRAVQLGFMDHTELMAAIAANHMDYGTIANYLKQVRGRLPTFAKR